MNEIENVEPFMPNVYVNAEAQPYILAATKLPTTDVTEWSEPSQITASNSHA